MQERANSARYLQRTFGIGRCLSPVAPPAVLQLPQLKDQPVYTAFFLYGVFQLWVVPAHSPCVLQRWFSKDLQVWTPAESPTLTEITTGALDSASKIVDLQFHHYDLEALMAVCIVDADGKDRCFLLESIEDGASECGCGGRWHAIGAFSDVGWELTLHAHTSSEYTELACSCIILTFFGFCHVCVWQ